MKQIYASIFAFFLVLFAAAQTNLPQVNAALSNSFIQIGQQVTLTLTVDANAADTVVFPNIGDTLRKEIEVVTLSKIDTTFNPNNVAVKQLSQTATLTSFDSGYFAIKPFVFKINQKTLETRPILLEVKNVTLDPDPQKMADIKPPLEVDFTFIDWLKIYWPYLVLVLLVIAVAYLIYYYVKNRKPQEKEVIVEQEPQIPPHVIALEKLEILKNKKLWQQGHVKSYYSELSEIFREYLENRFFIAALEMTTAEIISQMHFKKSFHDSLILQLENTLQQADLVKFAKFNPLPADNTSVFENVKQFIEQTAITNTIKTNNNAEQLA